MIQGSYWRSRSSKLQRFAKRFLRFVMLVAIAFVKSVCALANHVRADGHPLAAMRARPIFGSGLQQRACSQAALAFLDNQAIYFRPDFRFEKGLLAHVRPADHSIFRRVRHEYRVLRGRLDSRQPLAHLRRPRRIPQLAGKNRDPRRVGTLGSPDRQLLFFPVRCHQSQVAFRRSRDCTAALFNSRSASAAIHRAARVFWLRILSAARIASRFNGIFLLPIFRSARFTAFLTKFLSSCASRSITRRNFTKRAFGETLSL